VSRAETPRPGPRDRHRRGRQHVASASAASPDDEPTNTWSSARTPQSDSRRRSPTQLRSHLRRHGPAVRPAVEPADDDVVDTSTLTLDPAVAVHSGDALTLLATLQTAHFDAVVTDPPYAIKAPRRSAAAMSACGQNACHAAYQCPACLRAQQVAEFTDAAMLGQQSQNWHAKETHSRGYADNDPKEFQRWCRLWLEECLRVLKPGGHLIAFGGTRTWHRLAVAAEDVGFEIRDSLAWLYSSGMPKSYNVEKALAGSPHAALSDAWRGWGTALKPAFEPIVFGRKPLDGTMVHNVATWGVGPLNLSRTTKHTLPNDLADQDTRVDRSTGRGCAEQKWPTNMHLDHDQAQRLQSTTGQPPADYFWVSKPNRKERVIVDGVAHPTVKPLDLMRRLVRLVTPPEGHVLDPFAGSGTTIEACLLEGFHVTGIERDPAYLPLIQERIARNSSPSPAIEATADATEHDDGLHLF
jgi:DNA modification methylase